MRKLIQQTNWINVPDSIEEYFGFTYLITNLITSQKYLGRKNLWSVNRIKQPGKKRKKVVTKESEWRKYKSSSKFVQEEIKKYGEENFKFEILNLYRTKSSLNYAETKELIVRDVLFAKLENDTCEYYNDQILNRYFRNKILL